MNPTSPERPRPRVVTSRFHLPARRRALAHLARRATAAPPETARALETYLVLARALGQV